MIRGRSGFFHPIPAALALGTLMSSAIAVHAQSGEAVAVRGASGSVRQAARVDTMALRAHTYFLSHDRLGGRGGGSDGERTAAAYIASQLRQIGLDGAAPDGGYHQPVPLRALRIEPGTRLVVRRGTDSLVFRHGRDFVVGTGGPAAFRDFDGDVAFLGSPRDPDHGEALAGRVVALGSALGPDALDAIPVWHAAGVTGTIQLVPDAAQFQGIARSRGAERLYVDAPVDDPVWQAPVPSLVAGPALTAALLQGATLPESALRGAIVPPIDLGRHVSVRIVSLERTVSASNVAGVLPGADPALRDEYVVFTAHYDHLGIDDAAAAGEDSIYNGFSDNAAGVAMLLAIAREMRDDPPARSVLFLFLCAEERGLLGASFAATEPVVPLDRIAALINLDAGAPPAPPVSWRIAGGEGAALGRLARDIAASRGWTAALSAASPNSDYWPFLRRGVPAIFLIPGNEWEGVTAEQRDALRQRWDRYHRADDEWAADFPFVGIARYAEFALLVGRAAADPDWAPRRDAEPLQR
jgi:hypothetical protein